MTVTLVADLPPPWITVDLEPRYDSALANTPAVPAELHQYALHTLDPLRYQWERRITLTI